MLKKAEIYLTEKFQIKSRELSKLILLFLFSFFLGLFIALYFVPANSEFVEYYGSQQLPFAYIVSGIVGYLTSIIYSYLQRKVNSRLLFLVAIAFMIIIAISSRIGLDVIESKRTLIGPFATQRYIKYLSFFVFVFAWPFISMVAIVTGGLALRLFNLMQVKRYFGLVNIGGVIASIIGYFIIPLLLKSIGHQYNLIMIGSFSLLLCIFLLFIIYKRFPEKSTAEEYNLDSGQNPKIWNFLKNKFVLFIFISATFSTIAIYIADYGFLITIKEQHELFPSKEAVSLFISIVFGALKVGELIISLFSSRILSKWGVRLGLTILPLSVTLLLILAILSESFIGVQSMAFLAFITINKSFERIFRRGLDDPAFNVLYQTFPENQKLFIQTRVGVMMQFSIAIAGTILYFLSNLLSDGEKFDLGFYPVLVIPIIIVWIFISARLYRAYKQKIRQILDEKKMFRISYIESDIFGSQVLEKHLLGEDINAAKLSVVILSETNPRSLEAYSNFLLKIDDIIIRKSVLKNIDPTYSEKVLKTVEYVGNRTDFKERELRKLILQSFYNLDYSEIRELGAAQLENYIKSGASRDKIFLIKYLKTYKTENDVEIIKNLLEYNDKAVIFGTIKLVAKRKTKELYEKISTFMLDPEYSHVLVNVIVEIGSDILPVIDSYFNKESPTTVLLNIIEIYAKIGNEKAVELLVSHINFPNREVQHAIIYALFYCDYKAVESNVQVIKNKITEVAENILWIFVAIKDLEARKRNTLKIIQSLDLEREACYDILFNLLTFIYPPETIDLIKTNIIGENIIFAIEIIDNFISTDIKRLIIPLFDKINVNQRVKRLRPYFEQSELGFEGRLKDIIIKDFRYTDDWTKTKAIELVGKSFKNAGKDETVRFLPPIADDMKIWTEDRANQILKSINIEEVQDQLAVCLYHPSELIYSTAAKELYDVNPELCTNYLKSLSGDKQQLINILNGNNPIGVLIERVKLLKRIFLFYTVPEKSLVKLAVLIRSLRNKKGEEISFIDENGTEDIIIVIKGNLKYTDKKGKDYTYFKNDIIIKGLNVPQNAGSITVDKNSYVVLINRFEFFNLLVLDKEIIKHLFNRMKF